MKVELVGPIMCMKGKLFLNHNSLRILGGEVDELREQFSTENILAQKIGKKINEPTASQPTRLAAVRENSGPGHSEPTNRTVSTRDQGHGNQHSSRTNISGAGRNGAGSRSQPASVPAPASSRIDSTATGGSSVLNEDIDWGDDGDFDMDDADDNLLLSVVTENLQVLPQTNRPGVGKPRHQSSEHEHQNFHARQPTGTQSFNNKGNGMPAVTLNSTGDVQAHKRLKPNTLTPTNSYLQPPSEEIDAPDVDLDDDLELFEQVEMPAEEPKLVSSEPFVYLSLVKQKVEENPEKRFYAIVKVSTCMIQSGVSVCLKVIN